MVGNQKLLAIAVVVIALLLFFLAPAMTYTGDASSLREASPIMVLSGTTFTAQVSLSYALFGCREVYNPTVHTISYSGFTPVYQTYQLYGGGAWECK
ncbi:MAG: hypothetical protein OK438_01890 [Thaumarchaeota archaeon]|nr:hypothetical protein [Nitrososphaerota archaeon]